MEHGALRMAGREGGREGGRERGREGEGVREIERDSESWQRAKVWQVIRVHFVYTPSWMVKSSAQRTSCARHKLAKETHLTTQTGCYIGNLADSAP